VAGVGFAPGPHRHVGRGWPPGGALPSTQAEAGLLIITSFFSDGAMQAARGFSIQLIHRHLLWELLAIG
jgi:hypothetical protein